MTYDPKRPRRAGVIGLVAGLLCLAGIANSQMPPPAASEGTAGSAGTQFLSSARIGGVSSSAWYCAGPMPVGNRKYASSLAFANISSSPTSAKVTIATTHGSTSTTDISLPGSSYQVLNLVQSGVPGYAAASIIVSGAGVGVEQIVTGPTGVTSSACLAGAEHKDYLAAGSTLGGRNIALGIYNPTQTPSVANVSLVEAELNGTSKVVSPAPFQSIPLQPGQFEVLDIGHEVPQQIAIASIVEASGGSVAIGEMLTIPGQNKSLYHALVAGTPSPSNTWQFAGIFNGQRDLLAYSILNPSSKPAKVRLSFDNVVKSHDIQTTVPGKTIAIVDVPALTGQAPPVALPIVTGSQESTYRDADRRIRSYLATRQTPGLVGATMQSDHNVGVIVDETLVSYGPPPRSHVVLSPLERRILNGATKSAAATSSARLGVNGLSGENAISVLPALAQGTATTTGVTKPSKLWMLPADISSRQVGEELTITNRYKSASSVVVTRLSTQVSVENRSAASGYSGEFSTPSIPPERLISLKVGPGKTVTVDLDYLVGEPGHMALVVSATKPVTVGEALYGRGSTSPTGLALPPAIPVR